MLTGEGLASHFRPPRETGIQPRPDYLVPQLELHARQFGDHALAEVHHDVYRWKKPERVVEDRSSEVERP